MGLNALVISLDAALAVDENKATGNVHARQRAYAERLDSLHIIVKTTRSIKRKARKLRDNLFIYPASSLNRYLFLCDAYCIASKICRENKIDLVITQDPVITGSIGWLLKKRYNIPLNIQIAGDVIDNKYFLMENIFNLLLNELAKWFVRRADTIRVSTSKQKKQLAGLGIEDEKIWYIPFFIDFDLFFKNGDEKIRRKYLDGKFDRLVLYAGRLAGEKNLETLIRAVPLVVRNYPKVLFLIVGKGPEEKRLKGLVLDLNINDNISFTGGISYDRIPGFFSASDLFVITSLYEGIPMVLLEAAASGKPIVSTPHAGVYDAVIDGQTGYIVDFKDPVKIAEKILCLLENPKLAEKMGEAGRKYVLERFDREKILQDYIEMLRQTVSHKDGISGMAQKNKLWLTIFLKRLGILTYAKKIRRAHLFSILRKRYTKFYAKPDAAKLESRPLFYTFEPTLQCNLNCNFCYEKGLKREREREREEMSLSQIKKAFNTLKLDDQIVNLTGGEVFVRKDIFEILEYFKEKNVFSYIVTNGTCLKKDTVNDLSRYNIRGIEFSLDGPEDVHNKVRNSEGAFERLIKAIEVARHKFRVSVNCVIQERNINSLADVVLIAHRLKIKELNFQLEVFTDPKALEDTKQILGWDDLAVSLQVKQDAGYNFSAETLEAKWGEVKSLGRNLGLDINIYPSLVDKHIRACAQRGLRNSNLRLMCVELLTGRIDPYGNVVPCYIIRRSFGNLLDSSFGEIWNSPDFKEFRYKMATNNLLPICENCCKLGLV